MPNVAGKKFPYTKAGMAAAKKMAEKKAEDVIFETTDSGEPYWYYITDSDIGFYPVPDATSHTITEIYISIGGAMTGDADTPIIPAQYHDLLPIWASYKGCLEGDDDRKATFKGIWDEGLITAVRQITQRNLGQIDTVIHSKGDTVGLSDYDHDLGVF